MSVVNFTARAVEAIQPPASGQRDYWDESTPGFGLRVSFGGKKAWVVRYRVHGRLRRLTLGTYPVIGLADARQRAKLAMLEVSSGSDPAVEKRTARTAETFGNLAEEYLERHAKAKKRSWKDSWKEMSGFSMPSYSPIGSTHPFAT